VLPAIVETKSAIAEFPTHALPNPLKSSAPPFGREPALACAVNLSVPVLANPTVPVVPHLLAPSNGANSSVETPFQSLYGSLAGFENGAEQGNSGQQGTFQDAPVKKNPASDAAPNLLLTSAALASVRTSAPVLVTPALPQAVPAEAPPADLAAKESTDEQKQPGVATGSADSSVEAPRASQPAVTTAGGKASAPASNSPAPRATTPPLTAPPAKLSAAVSSAALPPATTARVTPPPVTQRPAAVRVPALSSLPRATPPPAAAPPSSPAPSKISAPAAQKGTRALSENTSLGKAASQPVSVNLPVKTSQPGPVPVASGKAAVTKGTPAPVETLPPMQTLPKDDTNPAAAPRLAGSLSTRKENDATSPVPPRIPGPAQPTAQAQPRESRLNNVSPAAPPQGAPLSTLSRHSTAVDSQPAVTSAPAPQPENAVAPEPAPVAPATPAESGVRDTSGKAQAGPVTNSKSPTPSGPPTVSRSTAAPAAQTPAIVPAASNESVAAPPVQDASNAVPASSPAPAPGPVAPNTGKPTIQSKQASPAQTPVVAPDPGPAVALAGATPTQERNEARDTAQPDPQLATAVTNPLPVGSAPAVAAASKPENLSFSIQMTHTDPLPPRAPVPQTKSPATEPAPAPARQPDSNRSSGEPQPSTASEASPDTPVATVAEALRRNSPAEPGLHWADSTPLQHADPRGVSVLDDSAEAAPAKPASPAAELQPLLEAPPKAPANQEILLQISGNNETTASIRVADRAGTVNISVHTADPDLRDSLRSNLGDLSSQLSAQGWRTEVSKPVTVAAHADNARDSRSEGERSSQQQQPAGGGRQQNQQRRANAGRWLQEFEEVSSQPASTGGKS